MLTKHRRKLIPLSDRGPLRCLFVITSMPVGGAETLLANLVRRMDRERFIPEICCLKEAGPLGETLAQELPVHERQLASKWDVGVFNRLRTLMRERRVDAVVTVGAGDKMFWGRLAASWESVPVICSALHSTGWPDTIGFLNRRLTSITDAFIAVARNHGEHLAQAEGFPADKVRVIPNGVDTRRFKPNADSACKVRKQLSVPEGAPLVGIVAALRPEKNHFLFLQAAALVAEHHANARFVIIGDGPERAQLEQLSASLGLATRTHFLGTRHDIPELVAALDIFSLTSHNEANPVSILEALSCEVPVVATRVGSVSETVIPGQTGFLTAPGDAQELAARWGELLNNPALRRDLGRAGRNRVEACWSLESMVGGYERLIEAIYLRKCGIPSRTSDDMLASPPGHALTG